MAFEKDDIAKDNKGGLPSFEVDRYKKYLEKLKNLKKQDQSQREKYFKKDLADPEK